MIDPKMFEELNAKMSAFLAASPAKDIEKNFKAALAGFFANLDLVTREEFDIQAELLARAQERLKALEARIDALERDRQAG
ncbi:MAG: accessory factor UbiK family protein [Betaproteobacteria bacterium]